jgi:hypothetical protein
MARAAGRIFGGYAPPETAFQPFARASGLPRGRTTEPKQREAGVAVICTSRYAGLMTVKERLHRVVEEMTDEEAEATLRRIDTLRSDPLVRFLDAAPIDDEPIAIEEKQALADVEADRAAGVPTISFDDIKSKYA